MNRLGLLLIAVAIIPSPARGDSWNPWSDQLIVAPGGKYYVVMKRTGGPKVYGEWGPVEYVLCECAADAAPIKPAKSKIVELSIDEYDAEKGGQLYEIIPNPKVSFRDGDKLLGHGTLKRPPLQIIVSDDGLGFACLDVYGYNYAYYDAGLKADNAVIIVSSRGKVIHRKRLLDLFTADELDGFDTSAGGMWWLNNRNPGWINDAKKQLVVVGAASESLPNRHLIKIIDWQTGRITIGATQNSQEAVKEFKREHLESNR